MCSVVKVTMNSKSIGTLLIISSLLSTVLCQYNYYDDEYNERDYNDGIEIPKFISTPQSFSVEVGYEITFPCAVDKEVEDYYLMFKYISPKGKDRTIYVGDTPVGRNRRMRKEGNNYVLSHVKKGDAGEYVCRFETDPLVELKHNLNVQFPAKVVRVSREIERVAQGTAASLECNAFGNPTPAITWSKKDGRLPSGAQSAEGQTITFEIVDRHYEGIYICTAANGIGEPSSTSITLQVEYSPEIVTEQTINKTNDIYEAHLICKVHGRPAPQVTWFRKENLVSSDRHTMTHDGGHTYSLSIKSLSEKDFGEYSCIAKNQHGESTSIIVVTGVPREPQMSSSPAGGELLSYTLTWNTDTFAPIIQYRIKYRKALEPHQRRGPGTWVDFLFPPLKTFERGAPFRHGNTEMIHAIEGLEPAEDYEATVQVENKFGWSDKSKIFRFSTRKEIAVGHSTSRSHHLALNFALVFLISFIYLL